MTRETLRHELRTRFEAILDSFYQDNPPTEDAAKFNSENAERLADAALEVAGIAKREVRDPVWDMLHGKTPENMDAAAEVEAVHNVALRLEKGLRRGQFPESTAAQLVYKWILKREAEGQSLDRFIAWAMDGNKAEFSFVYHKEPALIKRDWLQVFPPKAEQREDVGSGYYA